MKEKTLYWIGGSLVIVFILGFVWMDTWMGIFDGRQNDSEENSPQNKTLAAHENMNHGQMAPQGSSDPVLSAYVQEQDSIMMRMMQGMESIARSGNASIDFLNGMIPHHEAAVAMSENYLNSNAQNQQLKALAADIIQVQTDEIQQMKDMIQVLKAEGIENTEKAAAYLTKYDAMMASHHTMHTTAYNSVDEAFADGMILHHQMAVDMAKAVLDPAEDPATKQLAETIIATQQQEISQMKEILTHLKMGHN